MNVVDLIVRTANAEALDRTMQDLGAVVVDGSWNGDTAHVRCFGNVGYVRFAIERQGYGEIVGEESVSVEDIPEPGEQK